jgi:hypothetical protein
MDLMCDTREHAKEYDRIKRQIERISGIRIIRSKLYVGDYMSLDNPRLVIDRKKDLLELCGNVTQQHERFRDELIRAKEHGIKIVVLCEHGDDIQELEDVIFWVNPRSEEMEWRIVNGHPMKVYKYPKATRGDQLYKSLCTIKDRYGVEFRFCNKTETGAKIVEILGGENNGKG